MTRIYSGATKVEAKRAEHRFYPVTSGTDMTNIGGHPAALINAAGESAYIEVKAESGEIGHGMFRELYLVVVPVASAASMTFTLSLTGGQVNQAYNVKSSTGAQNFAATANQITEIDISIVFGVNTPLRRDYSGINVTYLVTATATNMYVLGVRAVGV